MGTPGSAWQNMYLDPESLKGYLAHYSEASIDRSFHITLVKHVDQGYNLVVHRGDSSPKIRIAVGTSGPKARNPVVGSTTLARNVIEELFTPQGEFSKGIKETIDRTLAEPKGSVMLIIKERFVVAAYFHEGELRP